MTVVFLPKSAKFAYLKREFLLPNRQLKEPLFLLHIDPTLQLVMFLSAGVESYMDGEYSELTRTGDACIIVLTL